MEELNRALFLLIYAPQAPAAAPLAIATFFAEYAIWLIPAGFVAVWLRPGDGTRTLGNAGPLLSNGVLSLDVATEVVTSNRQSIALSAREFALLEASLIRPGAILSRSDLEDRNYGWGMDVESKVVEFMIHSLRRKPGSDAIKNVRGVAWLVLKSK